MQAVRRQTQDIQEIEEGEARGAHMTAAALRTLAERWRNPPDLESLAEEAGVTPWHFQRLFSRWAGISPKRFSQFVAIGHARRLLRAQGADLLGASLDLGLSGPSRLHDLFLSVEAMTPGQYKRAGEGVAIRWGVGETIFGPVLAGQTERGLCWFSFLGDSGALDRHKAAMAADWPHATFIEDATVALAPIGYLDAKVSGAASPTLHLHLKGGGFQLKVWQALLSIPFAQALTYGAMASRIGHPGAARAVGNAVASNPVAFFIPCHRVIKATGALENYRWGEGCKRALLAWEACLAEGA
jgi:AraC family transcriptional regulator, regulatory protein of adaptative response / methylated-DNA-[protein]-cysteine methyltransferase